jgi:hypothetical protein
MNTFCGHGILENEVFDRIAGTLRGWNKGAFASMIKSKEKFYPVEWS